MYGIRREIEWEEQGNTLPSEREFKVGVAIELFARQVQNDDVKKADSVALEYDLVNYSDNILFAKSISLQINL